MATTTLAGKRVLTLANNEKVKGYTHRVEITPSDFTEATANTAEVFRVAVPKGTIVRPEVAIEVVTPLEDTADAAFNTNTVTAGHDDSGGAANTFLTSTETNKNGSFVQSKNGTGTQFAFVTAGKYLTITVNAMAAKSLTSLKKGLVAIYFALALPEEMH